MFFKFKSLLLACCTVFNLYASLPPNSVYPVVSVTRPVYRKYSRSDKFRLTLATRLIVVVSGCHVWQSVDVVVRTCLFHLSYGHYNIKVHTCKGTYFMQINEKQTLVRVVRTFVVQFVQFWYVLILFGTYFLYDLHNRFFWKNMIKF